MTDKRTELILKIAHEKMDSIIAQIKISSLNNKTGGENDRYFANATNKNHLKILTA